MFSILARMFGRGDRLIRLARGPDREAFARAFCQSSLKFLTLPDPAGLDLHGRSDDDAREALLKQIETAATELSRKTEFHPHVIPLDGGPCLPLFTTMNEAEKYIQQCVEEVQRAMSFELLTADGAAVGATFSAYAAVCLNPAGDHYMLRPDDIERITEIVGSS